MGSNNDKLPKSFYESAFYDLMKHMESFVDESFQHFHSLFNRQMFEIEVYETESDILMESSLPDCERDQIQLEIIGNHLRISVDDSAMLEEKNDQSISQKKEQSFKRMERLIPLPLPISEKDVTD
ncbi:Hsp20/alpha crystallin family protein [Alteribacillus bidgolensis]|uniref:Molecular chaperone IbpA, HSP20 family n=1 Tax=Alteribacillus bidgolensis TaxID=930129 RepID=A0A1G8R8P1_9BACI|nr:Hsp20/alpha crystallin family protein [Alteribacillus bidgolensis]SDJ13233.1 hypothetical protein SAMN05216352_12533 [Alteribacillus bidgolensis]